MYFDQLYLHIAADCDGCLTNALLSALGFFLLGLLLGWLLWHKYKTMINDLNAKISGLKSKINDQEKDYASLKYKYDELGKDHSGLRTSLNTCEADKATLQAQYSTLKADVEAAANNDDSGIIADAAAGAIVGSNTDSSSTASDSDKDSAGGSVNIDLGKGDDNTGIVAGGAGEGSHAGSSSDLGSGALGYNIIFAKNNLQVVEGIGPKISKILKGANVNNWSDLAACSNDQLVSILAAGNINPKMNKPKTWPEQARLANEGRWEDLVNYQKFLDTGVENKGNFQTPSKIEGLYNKAIGFASTRPDDLKVVEGIGPKIESLLKAAGVNTWTDLAACSVERIQEVLTKAGSRFQMAKPTTWPKQAQLASEGKWKELKEYQDFLDGGNPPA